MRRPNVVIIVADDLGYSDLGCHGCADIATPRIDSLARDGVRCAQGYVTASLCAPSRAALLTGRYPQRFGFDHNPSPEQEAASTYGLPRDPGLLSERMSRAGYATGMVGKWHLGRAPTHQPIARGFDSFFGHLIGSHHYLPKPNEPSFLLRGTEPVRESAYLTDAFGREAVDFVERHKTTPFFLYLSFNAVHVPLEADAARLERCARIADPRRRIYAAMLVAMDEAVGSLLDKLDAEGLAASTLVVFISDHGGPTNETTASNRPLRGEKGSVFEGGVRVPFFARWPERLPAGLVFSPPVSTLDLLPTAMAAAGAPVSSGESDGRDLVPYWTGTRKERPHEALFWRRGPQLAARVGDLKMVSDHGEPLMLFDLARDPNEEEDLAERHPAKLGALREVYQAWDRSNVPPAWAPVQGRPAVKPTQFVREEIERFFRRADADGDGHLSREELVEFPPLREWLKGADSCGDDRLSLAEVMTRFDAQGGAQPGNSTARGAADPIPKAGPDNDAGRDAAGQDQLFELAHVTGFTFIRDGMNGLALGDLDRDGRVDLVATYSPRPTRQKPNPPDRLRVFLNRGSFTFDEHQIAIAGSALAPGSFGHDTRAPFLVDLNGDGFLDIFVCRGAPRPGSRPAGAGAVLGNSLLVTDGAWDRFVDRSEAMGTRNELADNGKARFADLDGDGWLDIAIGCDNIGNALGGIPRHRLSRFVPRGSRFEDGVFEDLAGTELAPDFGGFHNDPARDRAGPGIELVDLDQDGDPDLVQACRVQISRPNLPYSPGEYRHGIFCWKNLRAETGAFRFERVTGNGLACEAWFKYDRVAGKYKPASPGKAPGFLALAVADVDADGRSDVLAIGPSDPAWFPQVEEAGGRLWRNEGAFRFADATAPSGLASLDHSYRRWYQFFNCPISEANLRFRPQKLASQPGLMGTDPLDTRPYFSDAVFGDFDNDGLVDLIVVDRRELGQVVARPILYLNQGGGVFSPRTTEFSGLDARGINIAAADLDDDGRLDLVLSADPVFAGPHADPSLLECNVYWNTGPAAAPNHHWLRVRCVGRDAIRVGARVELRDRESKALLGTQLLGSGGVAHFGLGRRTEVDVQVVLSSGKVVAAVGKADGEVELELERAR